MAIRGAMTLIAATILLTPVSAQPLVAGETSYQDGLLVRDADLIVVGTLRPMISYFWFDGIHMGGTMAVAEVLYGNPPERSLALRQIIPCNWSGPVHCDIRLWFSKPRAYPDTLTGPGIWFLKRVSDGTWRPSAIFGFDALSRRAAYEDYIRQHKR
jgi:hypothetical protein